MSTRLSRRFLIASGLGLLLLCTIAVSINEYKMTHSRKGAMNAVKSGGKDERRRALGILEKCVSRWWGIDAMALSSIEEVIAAESDLETLDTAVRILDSIGGVNRPEVRRFYEGLFRGGKRLQKYIAALQLHHVDSEKAKYLTAEFRHLDKGFRRDLVVALAIEISEGGRSRQKLLPLFVAAMNDEDSQVRTGAAMGLGALGGRAAYLALIERLRIEKSVGVRQTILEMISGMRPDTA